MATQWLRLWHEMPNDPKFRVVAKASGQPVSLVLALYTVLLVDASCNDVDRGVTTSHNESHAVTLDCDMSQIDAIVSAMQCRLLDGQRLIGWEKRQPKREYNGDDETVKTAAAVRKREQRERDRAALSQQVTTSHS